MASRNNRIPFCQAPEKYWSPDSVIKSLLKPFQDLCNQTHWKFIARATATYSFAWVMSFETIKLYNCVRQALPSTYWLLNQKVFKGAFLNDYRILQKANFEPSGTFWRNHCVTFRKVKDETMSVCTGWEKRRECGNYRNHHNSSLELNATRN